MLERLDLLYIFRLEVHGPYAAVSWFSFGGVRRSACCWYVGMIRQDASLAMNRAAEVTILSILLHNWICVKAGGLGVALGARF
jgi:hypothetical protein